MRRAPGGEPASAQRSMVTTLLVITVGAFVFQQVLNVFFPGGGGLGNRFFSDWFALSGQHFQQLKVWTVLSYGFLHSSAWATFFFIPIPFAHLVINMLMLYFMGRHVEAMLGRDRFLFFYLGAIFVGGLFFLFFNYSNLHVAIGASGGIAGILSYFCLRFPERTLILFPIPIPIKARWVLYLGLGVSLFGSFGKWFGYVDGIAHSAHLGGIVAALIYCRFFEYAPDPIFGGASPAKPAVELPEWFKRRKSSPVARKVNYAVNRSSSRDELQKEVDRILDKINASGFGSLSDREKQTLDHAKDILR